jgi:hypothetical protein
MHFDSLVSMPEPTILGLIIGVFDQPFMHELYIKEFFTRFKYTTKALIMVQKSFIIVRPELHQKTLTQMLWFGQGL